MSRLIVDQENGSEIWWDAARERANGMRSPTWTRIFNLIDGTDDEVSVTDGDASAFLAEARELPGWDDGPSHARWPVIVEVST